jgi:hypothetical protein
VSSESPQTAAQRRNLLVLGLAGGLGIASLVVLLATLLLTGTAAAGQSASTHSARVAADVCKEQTFPNLGQAHTENPNEKIKYNSFPPTSGKHLATPARWGNYPSPINQVQGVHNLEHGGIDIQYGNKVSAADVDKLMAYYDSDPNGILMAPLPALGSTIAATAWQKLLTCSKFDKKALDSFKKKHRYKGPERMPKDALEPGR